MPHPFPLTVGLANFLLIGIDPGDVTRAEVFR